MSDPLDIRPLTPHRWPDLETLFGPRGGCGGCWCMWWRLTRSEHQRSKGEANKQAFRQIVDAGSIPGLLAYRDDVPIGWCAVEPRSHYPSLGRSRVLAPLDDEPVWSVTCFFIARPHRGVGVATALLEAAAEHARSEGARVLEGYPVEPRDERVPEAFAWTGVPEIFERAGFREVARRSETRPIMRRVLERFPSEETTSGSPASNGGST